MGGLNLDKNKTHYVPCSTLGLASNLGEVEKNHQPLEGDSVHKLLGRYFPVVKSKGVRVLIRDLIFCRPVTGGIPPASLPRSHEKPMFALNWGLE